MFAFLGNSSLQSALTQLDIDWQTLAQCPDAPVVAQAVIDEIYAYEEEQRSAQEKALTKEEKFKYLRAWPVEREAGELLYLLVCHSKPQRVLECGTSFGLSTIFLASALQMNQPGKIITVEVSKLKHQQAAENFQRAKVNEYVHQEKMALDHYLKTAEGVFDLVFFDCDRSRYCFYLDQLKPHVRVGSLIIADNVSDRALDMVAYRQRVETDRKLATVFLALGDGLLISKVLAI